MHLSDLSVNFMTSIPIIGSSIPLAVGNALAEENKNKDNISVCFFLMLLLKKEFFMNV